MTRILIADDHTLIRTALRWLLQREDCAFEIGEAANGRETMIKVRQYHWDLLLLDLNMPDRDGLDILKHVRSSSPDTRVLVVSGYSEKQYGRPVLRAGASGFLSKEFANEELMRAVKTVLQGHRYVSTSLAEMIADDLASPRPIRLSDREFQIFGMIAGCKTISEIASELCLSSKTVSTYRIRILLKMGFTNDADIISHALKNGMAR